MSWTRDAYNNRRPELRPRPPGQTDQPARRTSSQQVDNMVSFTNAVYYPAIKALHNKPPSCLNASVISLVYYGFADIHDEGTVYFRDEHLHTRRSMDGFRGAIEACQALKRQNSQLKIVLSVGGRGGTGPWYPVIARNSVTRQRFASTCRAMVDHYGFDGIDIFWQYPQGTHEGYGFVELLAAVRIALPAPTFIVTSCLPPLERDLDYIPNLRRASEYVDKFNVMTFDFAGPWSSTSGHQAQLYASTMSGTSTNQTSCHSAMTAIVQRGVPKRKMLMGIPVYARSFVGVTLPDEAYHRPGNNGEIYSYDRLPLENTEEFLDASAGAVYSLGPQPAEREFISYDNPSTVQMKADYVRVNRLGGLFFFEGTDDSRGPRSLVLAGYCNLFGVM